MTSCHIPARLDRNVRQCAGDRCEYCRLSQRWQEARFHIDHIVPRSAGGKTTLDNLALACVSCSLRKAARLEARDPKTGDTVRLFNPRRDRWTDHFELTPSFHVRGTTAVGRATARALAVNRAMMVALRRELAALGE